MRRQLALVLLIGALVGAFFMPGHALAYPDDDPDTVAIRSILAAHRSPLPWWTLAAFKASHPDFDVGGYLAVAWAESSLGKAGRLNNPGSIKGGPVGSVWRDLRIGVTRSGYNRYASMYDGQRALIRLIYERGYNELLRTHQWDRFSRRYYGASVPGRATYTRTLRIAHDRIIREAASHGVSW